MENRLHELTAEAEALREEMRYYRTHLAECSGVIAEMDQALQQESDAMFDSDRVRYSARIEEAVANLTADRQYAVDTAENAYANNEFTVYLGGGNPLRFVAQPANAVIQEGEDVSFTVQVAGAQITSQVATLTVRDKVPTGDHSHLPLCLTMAALRKRRREKQG